MNFINNGRGNLINIAHVKYFYIDGKNDIWAVLNNITDVNGYISGRSEIYLYTGTNRTEAEKFLADLADKLNTETHHVDD